MTTLTKTVSLAATLALTSGAAQAVDMRCSHQLPPAHAVAQVIDRWAAEVERLSEGEIDVQIFGADSLVGAGENITSVASAIQQQTHTINNINGHMQVIDEQSRLADNLAQENEQAAGNLTRVANDMNKEVSKFKLE